MKPTVVILLSDKRSGSTLFERELCKHAAVRHVDYTPHTYNETHYWVKAACVLDTDERLFSGGVRPKSYGSKRAARHSLIQGIRGNVPDFDVPQGDRELIFSGWDALCERYANPVFFEKSPHHIHHWAALQLMLEWVEQTSFNVRFIGLIRNPMAVMYSALQLFYTDPKARQFGWAEGNRNLLKFGQLFNAERFKMLRYEDLVEDTVGSLGDICDFIGVDYQAHIGEFVNTRSLHKWRQDTMFDFKLDHSVAALAYGLGYSEVDLSNPAKPRVSFLQRNKRNLRLGFNRARVRLYDRVKRLKGHGIQDH